MVELFQPQTPTSGGSVDVTDRAGRLVGAVTERGSTAAVSSVDAADTSTNLAAANATRAGLIVANRSPQELVVKYGAGADPIAPSWTDLVPPWSSWSMPAPIYTGLVTGAWLAPFDLAQANGYPSVQGRALVTEITT